MTLVVNDGAGAPASHTFTQEQAQQGRNIPAILFDRSPALGPKSFLRLDALSRFGQGKSAVDQSSLHLYAPHWTDPGTGVLVQTGSLDGWVNINSTGTASATAVRQLFSMLLFNAIANATVKASIFDLKPLNI